MAHAETGDLNGRVRKIGILSGSKGDEGIAVASADTCRNALRKILYAYANGADIISMSFGSYTSSMAFEEALGRAYSKAVLVGAAGNDGYCLNHPHPEKGQMAPMPMFPGAYSFVLGVQASGNNSGLASFSNYDDDGPTFSGYPEEQLYNYEIMVPGVSITSTYPGGTYKALNGTSMATPLVAGALSRLLQCKEYLNKEELFGDLINSTTSLGNMDIMVTYNIKPEDRKPDLQFVTFEMVDEDGDGRADAGEEVAFYPVIRNNWGNVSGIKISLGNGETGPAPYEIIDNNVDFGSTLSSYGKAKSVNPLKIKLNDNVADGRIVMVKFTATADNAETIEQTSEIKVENAVTLTGILKEDMTLTPDQHYVITGTFGVPEGRTLTIEPGTTIKFRDDSNLSVNGHIVANGKPGNLINFTKADLDLGNIYSINLGNDNDLSYCHFSLLNTKDEYKFGSLSHCIFENSNILSGYLIVNTGSISCFNCQFNNISSDLMFWSYASHKGQILHTNITNCITRASIYANDNWKSGVAGIVFKKDNGICSSNVFNNTLNGHSGMAGILQSDLEVVTFEQPSYLGTSNTEIANKRIIHVNNQTEDKIKVYGEYDFSNMPERPYAEAHGIVWKVLVNGKDAQDEFDQMDPLGVGIHTFDVYFNRPMNKEKVPFIAMGVRAPYTQTGIGEEGHWNDDGTIYTAKLTLTGKENIDGLNRIYVNEAEDNEFFPIPVEDTRFNVMVQAAGSLSDGFYATEGLGKVELNWDSNEDGIDDLLGYNLYRYTVDEGGNASETIQLNKRLIDETTFTDFDVVPGTTYLYYYKSLRTNMSENSPSKVVAATPKTAAKGDANGSMDVNVADVVTEVNYIIGMNPQPFIFEAADVNADQDINVLDVVGTINIINTPSDAAQSNADADISTAYFSVEDGVLYVDCASTIGGLQVRLNANRSKDNISKAGQFSGFEQVANWVSDNEYLYMLFSMSGQTIAPGHHALLNIGESVVTQLVASNVSGTDMPTEFLGRPTGVETIETSGSFRVYPNPVTDILNIEYTMPCDAKVFFVIDNAQGVLVNSFSRFSTEGKNTLTLNASGLPAGTYFIQMIVDGRNVKTFKVIKK